MNELRYVHIRPEHAPALAQLQLICFPSSAPEALFDEEDLRRHAAVFPEGTYVVLDGDQPIGMGVGIFVDFDFSQPQHTLEEIAGPSGIEGHKLDGLYYYGTDISVHPTYRRRGIGRRLYQLRQAIAVRHHKKGIIGGGVLPGFEAHKAQMSALTYVNKVVAGELYDPTLTFQLENGFVVRGVLENYFDDARSDNWASLIYWENPEYRS